MSSGKAEVSNHIDVGNLAKDEHGFREPRIVIIGIMAKALGVTAGELLDLLILKI